MAGQAYESVKKSEEAASAAEAVDKGTARFAMAVSLLSCVVSLVAIGFVIRSIHPEQN